MATTSLVLDAVEDQIARLRRARPHLEKRISKAEHILTMHFAMPGRHIIRARVRGEHVHYLVRGSGGAVYTVDPHDWSCSCPDYHRRGGVCKHALACWALSTAPVEQKPPSPEKRAYISGQSQPTDSEVYARRKAHRRSEWDGVTVDMNRLDKVAERLGV
jgi:SWIM zinc finger